MAIGAVAMFVAIDSGASVPNGGKFERAVQPASCWFFCAPQKR
jgi:hypothetical protein